MDSAVVSIDSVGSAVDPEPIDVYPPGKGRRPPIDWWDYQPNPITWRLRSASKAIHSCGGQNWYVQNTHFYHDTKVSTLTGTQWVTRRESNTSDRHPKWANSPAPKKKIAIPPAADLVYPIPGLAAYLPVPLFPSVPRGYVPKSDIVDKKCFFSIPYVPSSGVVERLWKAI